MASFVTAGVTGAIGIVSVGRANEPRELPLAATPILFALQQTIEGLLWLDLPLAPDGFISTALTLLFLFFAEVFWPIYAPIVVLLLEPSGNRRNVMFACLAIGVAVGCYLLWSIVTGPHSAIILDDHIFYVTEHRRSDAVALAYLAATSLPLFLSSHRTVVILGAIICGLRLLLGSVRFCLVFFSGSRERCDPVPFRMVTQTAASNGGSLKPHRPAAF